MKTARVSIEFDSNQEAIDLYYLIEFKDIMERLLFNTRWVSYIE